MSEQAVSRVLFPPTHTGWAGGQWPFL